MIGGSPASSCPRAWPWPHPCILELPARSPWGGRRPPAHRVPQPERLLFEGPASCAGRSVRFCPAGLAAAPGELVSLGRYPTHCFGRLLRPQPRLQLPGKAASGTECLGAVWVAWSGPALRRWIRGRPQPPRLSRRVGPSSTMRSSSTLGSSSSMSSSSTRWS